MITVIITLWVISVLVAFGVGYVVCGRRTPKSLAKMSTDQLASFADRVRSYRANN